MRRAADVDGDDDDDDDDDAMGGGMIRSILLHAAGLLERLGRKVRGERRSRGEISTTLLFWNGGDGEYVCKIIPPPFRRLHPPSYS
jgi:hypothetical protein